VPDTPSIVELLERLAVVEAALVDVAESERLLALAAAITGAEGGARGLL